MIKDTPVMLKRLVLAIVASASCAAAHAQSPPIPCAGDAVTAAPAAVAAADSAFKSMWLDQQPNWYTAFEARAPKRNVFDISAEAEPPLEAVKGIAWAHGVFCIASLSPRGDEVLVRYFARVAAFHEGDKWSRPFMNGLIQAYLTKRGDDVWRTEPVARERTILLPNSLKSHPDLAAIPATDTAKGIPCPSGTIWDGKLCVLPRARPRDIATAKPVRPADPPGAGNVVAVGLDRDLGAATKQP